MNNKPQDPAYQAYKILHVAFSVLFLVFGLDKFFNTLTTWSQYLSGPFNILSSAYYSMMVVGIFEAFTGLGLLFKPRIFAPIAALWLLVIAINLAFVGQYWDIVLHDLTLFLAACALSRLSTIYDT